MPNIRYPHNKIFCIFGNSTQLPTYIHRQTKSMLISQVRSKTSINSSLLWCLYEWSLKRHDPLENQAFRPQRIQKALFYGIYFAMGTVQQVCYASLGQCINNYSRTCILYEILNLWVYSWSKRIWRSFILPSIRIGYQLAQKTSKHTIYNLRAWRNNLNKKSLKIKETWMEQSKKPRMMFECKSIWPERRPRMERPTRRRIERRLRHQRRAQPAQYAAGDQRQKQPTPRGRLRTASRSIHHRRCGRRRWRRPSLAFTSVDPFLRLAPAQKHEP